MQQPEGLRARKQRQTRDAIHRAAVDLAIELGPDAATVAEISARVDISPRTFFNYYPSKEDAFVGVHEGLPSDDELAELREGTSDDLIGDILTLMIGVFTPSDETLITQRKELMHKHPHLMQRQWARMIGVEQRIGEVVAERMRAAGTFGDVPDIDDAARALVVTCNAVLRLSIRKIVADHTSTASIRPQADESLRMLREVLNTLP
ncbi:TetR/AcrR family transcriptional regulator [Microbacterium sp.]|uniref:TetR/AcrR family transcriptional regulator n=1 Tax=Microbacterium sp. TaxID=51671 RepID=UPI003F9447BF